MSSLISGYFPSCLLLIVSLASFWISSENKDLRIMMPLTAMLVSQELYSQVNFVLILRNMLIITSRKEKKQPITGDRFYTKNQVKNTLSNKLTMMKMFV